MNDENSEQYWRNQLSSEIKEAIDSKSEINAYGAYLIVKGHNE